MGTRESFEGYDIVGVIGEGSYGIVYRATERASGRTVVIKSLKTIDIAEGVSSSSLREVSILQQTRHANIVELLGVGSTFTTLYLVFESLQFDLRRYLAQVSGPLSSALVVSYALQLLRALTYCHRHSIAHRDVKPDNILVSRTGIIKLADFGMARFVSRGGASPASASSCPSMTREVVTLWYRAPELLVPQRDRRHDYDTSIDVWSAGCVLSEMITRRPLFTSDSEDRQLHAICRVMGTPPNMLSSVPEYRRVDIVGLHCNRLTVAGRDLLCNLLSFDASRRIRAEHAVSLIENSMDGALVR